MEIEKFSVILPTAHLSFFNEPRNIFSLMNIRYIDICTTIFKLSMCARKNINISNRLNKTSFTAVARKLLNHKKDKGDVRKGGKVEHNNYAKRVPFL